MVILKLNEKPQKNSNLRSTAMRKKQYSNNQLNSSTTLNLIDNIIITIITRQHFFTCLGQVTDFHCNGKKTFVIVIEIIRFYDMSVKKVETNRCYKL